MYLRICINKISHANVVTQFSSCSSEILRFASTIFIVVEPEHTEICKCPSIPVLLETIALRLPCGKLLLLLVLFGLKAERMEKHGESLNIKCRRYPCIWMLTEKRHNDEKLTGPMEWMLLPLPYVFLRKKSISTFVSEQENLPYCFLLFQTWYFVDDNQHVEVWYCIYCRFSQQQPLLSETLVCKLRCDTQGAPLDADEFSSCWCDS